MTSFGSAERQKGQIPRRLLLFTIINEGVDTMAVLFRTITVEDMRNPFATVLERVKHFSDVKNVIIAMAEREWKDIYVLRHIDPVGRTMFNRLQVPQLLKELELLKSRARNEEELSAINSLAQVATTPEGRPEKYVLAIGD